MPPSVESSLGLEKPVLIIMLISSQFLFLDLPFYLKRIKSVFPDRSFPFTVLVDEASFTQVCLTNRPTGLEGCFVLKLKAVHAAGCHTFEQCYYQ